jgi:hypothetical protein
MSIRDIPREQLELGKTRLQVARRKGVLAGFPHDRIGEVLVLLDGHSEPFAYSVDDVEVAS